MEQMVNVYRIEEESRNIKAEKITTIQSARQAGDNKEKIEHIRQMKKAYKIEVMRSKLMFISSA
jgi:hypothetical protein